MCWFTRTRAHPPAKPADSRKAAAEAWTAQMRLQFPGFRDNVYTYLQSVHFLFGGGITLRMDVNEECLQVWSIADDYVVGVINRTGDQSIRDESSLLAVHLQSRLPEVSRVGPESDVRTDGGL